MSLLRAELDLGAKLELKSAGVLLVARLSSNRARWRGQRAVAVSAGSIRAVFEKLEATLEGFAQEEAQTKLELEE